MFMPRGPRARGATLDARMPYLTRMMLTVRGADEAASAADAGVDCVEWVAPAEVGFDASAARAIRAAFPGCFRIRLQGSPGVDQGPRAIREGAKARADEVAICVDASSGMRQTLADGREATLIALIAAADEAADSVERLRGRAGGVMLDTSPRRLIDGGGVARLDAFADACRRAGLSFGFAGRLEAPDIARLLLLRPDVLGFDIAARSRQEPGGPLDPGALEAIRAMIPKDAATTTAGEDAVVTHRSVASHATDVLFVRDFVTTMSIGAYRQEHGRRQRVRFSVEATVLREPVPPRDMRDVFSYDVIIETIRVLAERGHATFVETLAEEIAAALLTHAALAGVTVRVEKLDVIDGAVGIEIRRVRR